MYPYYEIDTPPATTSDNPVITEILLARGFLDFVDIGIPDWVNRLCKCRIFYNEFQILPWNKDTWFSGDDINIRVPIKLWIIDEPYRLTIYTYNDDDTYKHQLSFGFGMDFGKVEGKQGLLSLLQPAQVTEE